MTANENYSSPAKPEVKSTTASTKTKSSLTSRFTMANFPPKIKKINKKRVKTARTRQAKTKTVECYILIRESAVRGPETELMKINCPEESREKLNLSTYLIQYRVLRQPPASEPRSSPAPRASKQKKNTASCLTVQPHPASYVSWCMYGTSTLSMYCPQNKKKETRTAHI